MPGAQKSLPIARGIQIGATGPAGKKVIQLVPGDIERWRMHRAQLGKAWLQIHQAIKAIDQFAQFLITADQIIHT